MKGIIDLVLYIVVLLGTGWMISVYAQLGFFSYLILNYIGKGMFSKKVWSSGQFICMLFVLFDVMFLRKLMCQKSEWIADIWLGIFLLFVSLFTTMLKVKRTNITSAVPTLFFMVVFTAIELIGVLKIDVNLATLFIAVPLVVCNAYQIVSLHRITNQPLVQKSSM